MQRRILPHKYPSRVAIDPLDVTNQIRQSPSNYFYIYTRTIIPQMESHIEKRLLKEFTRRCASQLEKQEVMEAYNMRRHNLSLLDDPAD